MLRKNFPTERPVIVRRVKKKTSESTLFFDSAMFRVYISTNQSAEAQIDAILHEASHVLAIEESCRHEEIWSKYYGKIYSKFEQWNSEK
jgi:hypothetical protein